MRGRLRSLTYRVYQRALLPAARVLLDPLLRSDFGYRLLIALPIAAEDFLLFPLRERSHRLRLRSRGAGGYL